MKKFLFKISLYIIGIIAVLLYLGSFADGNTDDNYRHFTGPKPSDMILGDSRGVQAVVPDVLDGKFKGRTFNNFAFNIGDSPYGPVYLKALKRKINPDTKNGIFILTVDPWNLSVSKDIKSVEDFPEKVSSLNSMIFYDMDPNYEYLIRNFSKSWFNIYRDREAVARSNTYLHKNGWMEVSVDITPDTIRKREDKKVKEYIGFASKQVISQDRIKALEDMIGYLKGKGEVYLVRIPASERLMQLEHSYASDFSMKMRQISKKNGVRFFDFSSDMGKYIYTDGNHMYKESGKVFTAQIADSILQNKKPN
ncbi:hypothetical protein HNP38_001912 [Chryseobacterium defluvii]|uniref:D-alanine transfer protein n=1 Tax=Chryseobacterium defluvii TaxID=160396 RepID=A0A840KBN8_9FLAO|nr:hypothetical protein [Chryseobacterium defluvii]MBB4806616.1 hypothetical protein [Chryseobacterium defluvii]